jgi:hypothetical protein
MESVLTHMASSQRVHFPCTQVVKTDMVCFKLCKRDNTKKFHKTEIKLRLPTSLRLLDAQALIPRRCLRPYSRDDLILSLTVL